MFNFDDKIRKNNDSGGCICNQIDVYQHMKIPGEEWGRSPFHSCLASLCFSPRPRTLHNTLPRSQGAVALTVGSVPRRIVPKLLRHFHRLSKINNQWKLRNLGTILRGTDPTGSETPPGFIHKPIYWPAVTFWRIKPSLACVVVTSARFALQYLGVAQGEVSRCGALATRQGELRVLRARQDAAAAAGDHEPTRQGLRHPPQHQLPEAARLLAPRPSSLATRHALDHLEGRKMYVAKHRRSTGP